MRFVRCGRHPLFFVGRGCAGLARRRRPTRTCTARRRAGGPAGCSPARSRAPGTWRASRRPARGRAHRGRRRRCSRGSHRGVWMPIPAAIRRPPTVRKASRIGPSGPNSSNSRRTSTRLWRRPRCRGRARRSPQRRWCRSMNASRSSSGRADSSSRTSPAASARRSLRRISWRVLLAERREVVLERRPGRHADDRADVLALDVEGPALGDLARAERRGQRVGRRVAAAQAAQVDHVPRRGADRRGPAERRGGRRGHRPRRAGRAGRRAPSRSRRGRTPRRRWPSRLARPA